MNLEQLADFLGTFDNEASGLEMGFDMSQTYVNREYSEHPCGSACCIGGWVQHFNTETRAVLLVDAVMHVSSLSRDAAQGLCFPGPTPRAYRATPQQAAQAIRNAIKFDDPKWDEVMA